MAAGETVDAVVGQGRGEHLVLRRESVVGPEGEDDDGVALQEFPVLLVCAVAILLLGIYPGPLLDLAAALIP